MNGVFSTGIIALGVLTDNGRNRVPRPPTNISAFMK
jgi:hypothetical protein